ncbi:MAG: hypothetical protein D9V47_12090 [Clostridia bacterium]|nr:MAG: hypothetical protein D9V47_12090 [Clostridia bacterium]
MNEGTAGGPFGRVIIEEVIRKVRGVLAVRVIGDEQEVAEIHILANRERTPKQLVRDVESALLLHLGVSVDYKKISILQLEPEGLAAGISPVYPWVTAIRTGSSSGQWVAEVELTLKDSVRTYKASCPMTRRNRLRVVAMAITGVLEPFFGTGTVLIVEDVLEVEVAHRRAVVVAVDLALEGNEEKLVGCAYVETTRDEAVAQATLRAVGYHLAAWLT